MEFLDWIPKHEYPEVMSIDHERMQELESRAFRLCCIASVIGIISSLPIIQQQTATRMALIKQVSILFEHISNDK